MKKENIHFVAKTLKLSKLINLPKPYLSMLLSNLLKKPIVWGQPSAVMVEPTNICNLKCPLCPSGNGTLKRKKGYMSLSLFKQVVDQIAKNTWMILFWNQGEPFLNPDILDMISYSAQNKIFSLLSTNGNKMPNAKEIVDSGLDSLIVSLDGATQQTYNKYRVNGVLDKVLHNVRDLVQAKKERNSKTPYIKWQFIVMKHNEHEIEKIRKLADEVGVDELQLKTVQIYSKEDIFNFLPQNPKYRRYKTNGSDFELKYKIRNRCRRLWTQPVVNWNGEVSVCCFDKDIKYKIGNIMETDFKKLWKNEKFMNFRKNILKNRKKIPMCLNCGEGVSLRIKQN